MKFPLLLLFSCALLLPRISMADNMAPSYAPTGLLTAFPRAAAEREAADALLRIVAQANQRPNTTAELGTLYIAARGLAQLGRIEAALGVADLLEGARRRGQVVDVRQHIYLLGVKRRTILGDEAGARRLLARLKAGAEKEEALMFMARRALADGRYEEARRLLYAIPPYAGLYDFRGEVAELLAQTGDFAGARRVLDRLQDALESLERTFERPQPLANGRDDWTWRFLAERYWSVGEGDAALNLYRRSGYKIEPNYERIAAAGEWMLFDEIVERRRALFEAANAPAHLAQELAQVALVLHRFGRAERARERYEEARGRILAALEAGDSTSPWETTQKLPLLSLQVIEAACTLNDEASVEQMEKAGLALLPENDRLSFRFSLATGSYNYRRVLTRETLWRRLRALQTLVPATEGNYLRDNLRSALKEVVEGFRRKGDFAGAREALRVVESLRPAASWVAQARQGLSASINLGLLYRALLWQIIGEEARAQAIVSAVRRHHARLPLAEDTDRWESLGRFGVLSPVARLGELPSLSNRASVMQAYVSGLTGRFFQPLEPHNTWL